MQLFNLASTVRHYYRADDELHTTPFPPCIFTTIDSAERYIYARAAMHQAKVERREFDRLTTYKYTFEDQDGDTVTHEYDLYIEDVQITL